MEKIPQNPEEFLQAMQDLVPTVTPTKTGYEIRTKILELAQTQAFQPMMFKAGQYSATTKWEADEIVTSFDVPDAEAVLKIATQFLDFVNNKNA